MNKYYIEDGEKNFWCNNYYGYWSKHKKSLKNRVEGDIINIGSLWILMRMNDINCHIKSTKKKKCEHTNKMFLVYDRTGWVVGLLCDCGYFEHRQNIPPHNSRIKNKDTTGWKTLKEVVNK